MDRVIYLYFEILGAKDYLKIHLIFIQDFQNQNENQISKGIYHAYKNGFLFYSVSMCFIFLRSRESFIKRAVCFLNGFQNLIESNF